MKFKLLNVLGNAKCSAAKGLCTAKDYAKSWILALLAMTLFLLVVLFRKKPSGSADVSEKLQRIHDKEKKRLDDVEKQLDMQLSINRQRYEQRVVDIIEDHAERLEKIEANKVKRQQQLEKQSVEQLADELRKAMKWQ